MTFFRFSLKNFHNPSYLEQYCIFFGPLEHSKSKVNWQLTFFLNQTSSSIRKNSILFIYFLFIPLFNCKIYKNNQTLSLVWHIKHYVCFFFLCQMHTFQQTLRNWYVSNCQHFSFFLTSVLNKKQQKIFPNILFISRKHRFFFIIFIFIFVTRMINNFIRNMRN